MLTSLQGREQKQPAQKNHKNDDKGTILFYGLDRARRLLCEQFRI